MSKILNFQQFSILESNDSSEYLIPGINPYMMDGYEIIASDCTSSDPVDGKLSIRKDSGTSLLLTFGKDDSDIWIPKDSIKIEMNDDNYTLTIDPESKWFNKPENRNIIEDFIESFDSHRIDLLSKDARTSNSVRDDIDTILDMLGMQMEISGIEKISDDEYDVSFSNGINMSHKRRSPNDIIGTIKMYLDSKSDRPGIVISSAKDGINLISSIDDIVDKNIETSFSDIKNNPYHRYLLKRPMNMDTNFDKEELYKHYLDSINSSDRNKLNSEDDNIADSARNNISYLKDLRKLVSEYVSSDKIREISPDL